MEETKRYKIKLLEKALKILELFDEKGKELSATEINQALGLNKSTVFRILSMLDEADYLERSPSSLKYRLGFKIYHLGSFVEANAEYQKMARPFLEDLVKKCDETVHLVVLHHGEALYLDKIEGNKSVRVVSRTGMKLPAHCSGVGKVLLASLPEATVRTIIKERGLRRFTGNTITHKKTLMTELAKIRGQGFAVENEEIEAGLKCVAAPVTGPDGEVVAAISISGPRQRFGDSEVKRWIPLVIQTAKKISDILRAKSFNNHLKDTLT